METVCAGRPGKVARLLRFGWDAFTEGRNGAIIPMMNIMYAGGMSHAAENEF